MCCNILHQGQQLWRRGLVLWNQKLRSEKGRMVFVANPTEKESSANVELSKAIAMTQLGSFNPADWWCLPKHLVCLQVAVENFILSSKLRFVLQPLIGELPVVAAVKVGSLQSPLSGTQRITCPHPRKYDAEDITFFKSATEMFRTTNILKLHWNYLRHHMCSNLPKRGLSFCKSSSPEMKCLGHHMSSHLQMKCLGQHIILTSANEMQRHHMPSNLQMNARDITWFANLQE